MLTVHAIPAGLPLLTGVLGHHRRGTIPGRPCQVVDVWCPACHAHHSFPVPDVFPLEAVEVVASQCAGGPWRGSKIAVGLDQTRKAEHRRAALAFAARLRRWLIEQRLRHQLAESRALDRRHMAEWDVVAT